MVMSKRVVATGKDGAILFVRNAGTRIECWYIAYPHADANADGYASVPHNGQRAHIEKVWRQRYAR
jgi:hypothetical protein